MSRSIHENIKQYVRESKYIYLNQDEKIKSLDAVIERLVKKAKYKKDERLKRQRKKPQVKSGN